METVGRFGCKWEGGTGCSPDGNFCGECTPSYESFCPQLESRRRRVKQLTVVLPCAVGDTVYRVVKRSGYWRVLPREVISITYRLDYKREVMWEIFTTSLDALGTGVFLTEEEAQNYIERRTRDAT